MSSEQAIDYLISQTRDNISLLQSIQRISPEDARDILAKLPATESSLPKLSTDARFPSPFSAGYDRPPARNSASILTARPPPPTPAAPLFRAKTLWAYNEDKKELNDLTFAQGDIVEVTDEKNFDWWSGRLNGKEGLFPSAYVERLPPDVPPAARSFPDNRSSQYVEKAPPPPSFPNGIPYSSPPYPYPQQNPYFVHPPPPTGPYPPYQAPPQAPPPPPTVVVTTEGQKPGGKKHGFFSGSLGNTLAQSAAGGVGFGAGSAVGSGIVNAIF